MKYDVISLVRRKTARGTLSRSPLRESLIVITRQFREQAAASKPPLRSRHRGCLDPILSSLSSRRLFSPFFPNDSRPIQLASRMVATSGVERIGYRCTCLMQDISPENFTLKPRKGGKKEIFNLQSKASRARAQTRKIVRSSKRSTSVTQLFPQVACRYDQMSYYSVYAVENMQ